MAVLLVHGQSNIYPSLPYFDIQVIEGQRNLGVGYIFLLLLKLYLKKMNKVIEEDAYNTKIISLKKSTRERSFVLRLCSLFQGRVETGTLSFNPFKLSTLSTFVKICLSTFIKRNSQLSTLSTLRRRDIYSHTNHKKGMNSI